jgi:hypothetical protein
VAKKNLKIKPRNRGKMARHTFLSLERVENDLRELGMKKCIQSAKE